MTTNATNVYQHPFNLSWKTVDTDPDIEPLPKFSTVYDTSERRAWGLTLGLIMTPLTRKFDPTEVSPGVKLSAPDATAFTWCVKHYGGMEVCQLGKKSTEPVDVKPVLDRWKRSKAKTWIALVAGGGIMDSGYIRHY